MRGVTCFALVTSWLLLAQDATAEESNARPASEEAPATPGACVPACRTGYVCIDSRCVMACNPPCSAGERCTAQGECEPRVEATSREFSTDSSEASTGEQTADDAGPETRPTRRNSTGMMVTGIVLASVGWDRGPLRSPFSPHGRHHGVLHALRWHPTLLRQ